MFPIHDDNQRIHGRPYVNYFLISVNIIIFLWEVIVTDFFSNPDKIAQIFLNYGAVPNSVLEGNFLSLITAMFLHGGVAHLIGNMVFLFIFGDNGGLMPLCDRNFANFMYKDFMVYTY